MTWLTRVFSSEHTVESVEQAKFWLQVEQATLKSHDGLNLAYAKIIHPDNRRAIVISNGRIESYLKYQELIFDCYQQGFSVYAIDHRGQGLSSRLTTNPNQGHVGKFNDYVVDFHLFMTEVVQQNYHDELFLVGHSMGGAIGTHYLHQHPQMFNAAIFSAPMFGIRLPLATAFIRLLAATLSSVHTDVASGKITANYVIGGRDYRAIGFKHNELTHSERRYQAYRNLYQTQPLCQLGSPTNHWLCEAIDGAKSSIDLAKHSPVPILILQAMQDKIVCNKAQDAAQSNQCRIAHIGKAAHEIFIEKDEARNLALNQLFDFINQHSAIV